jgi:galactonate dehydratase
LGVPVYEMLGGPVRDRLQRYWSHCGTYRARHAERIKEWTGADPVRSLDDLVRLGEEVAQRSFKGLKGGGRSGGNQQGEADGDGEE